MTDRRVRALRSRLPALVLAWACGGSPSSPTPPAAFLTLIPDSLDLAAGLQAPAVAVVLAQDSSVLSGALVTFVSRNPAVFEVTNNGVVTGVSSGASRLVAMSGAARDSIPVVVFRSFPRIPQRAAVPGRPFGVQVSQQGVMYVTQQDGDALTRFDLPSLTSTGTVSSVGNDPGEVVFTANGQVAYTVNVLGGDASRVDVGAGTVSTTYPVGETVFRIRLSMDETRLYLSTPLGTVRVLNAATGADIDTIAATSGPANGMALSPSGNRLFVSSTTGGIAEINTATGAVLRTMPVAGELQDLSLSPDGTELYVADELGWLKVVNVGSGLAIDSVALPGAFGLSLSPDGHFIVVAQSSAGRIAVFDRVLRRLVREFPVGGQPRRVAFDASGATLAVANEANAVDVIR
jgi:DNA-binding beta-propeller fold protein YncE